jgi:hypothetical protein
MKKKLTEVEYLLREKKLPNVIARKIGEVLYDASREDPHLTCAARTGNGKHCNELYFGQDGNDAYLEYCHVHPEAWIDIIFSNLPTLVTPKLEKNSKEIRST